MQISALAHRVLQTVFALSAGLGALSRAKLAKRTGASSSELERALVELAHHGLLDAQRLRLTLSGLAISVASRARAATPKRRAHAAQRAAQLPVIHPPIALFSRREAPRAVA